MAGRDAALGRLDAAVFLAQAEALRDLHPFLGEAEILHAECLSDADRDVALRVCRHIRDDILRARRRDRWGRLDADAGKSAVHAQHPAGAALGRRVAWAVLRVNHEVRLMLPVFAVVELCKQAAGRFAA
jgi:hypothetical protein